MQYGNTMERLLRELSAPRRNRYYYGKMLDVPHLEMEQVYGMQMRCLGNRLTLGSGVLCGLRVALHDGKLCVDPGVAIDGLGREIVVPVRTCLDPWKLTDACGQAQGLLSKDAPHRVTLYLCYNECLTDQAPVLVSDCDQREASEAGTVVETFRLEVREGQPEPREPSLNPKCCDALFTRTEGSRDLQFEVVTTIEVGGRPIAAAASADGRHVVVANQWEPIPRVQVIRVADNSFTQLSSDNIIPPMGGLTLAPDGGPTYLSHASGVAVIDHTQTPPALVERLMPQVRYGACAAARGGAVLFAVEHASGLVHQINTANGNLLDRLDVGGAATDLAVSADSQWLFVTREQDSAIIRFAVADVGNRSMYEDSGTAPTTLAVRMHDGAPEPHVAVDNKVLALRQADAVPFTLQGVQARDSAFTSTGQLYYVTSAQSTDRPGEIVVQRAETMEEVERLPVGTAPAGVAIVPDRMLGYIANAQSGTVTVIDGRWIDEPSGQVDPLDLLCQCAAQPCPEPTDACVPIAAVELRAGGEIGRIDECAVRPRIYSNQMLLELILCLAARLEECCRKDEQPATPPKVAAVEVLDINGDVLEQLADPSDIMTFESTQLVRSLRFVFTAAMDAATVVAGGAGEDPQKQSFQVVEADDNALVPGVLTFEDPRAARWDSETDSVPPGRYRVRLSGDPDPDHGRPAIRSTAGVNLDGEPHALPSGDGNAGGTFELRLEIEDPVLIEPPMVSSLSIVSSQNDMLTVIEDPREPPTTHVEKQPRSIRIGFTAPIEPTTIVATGADATKLNFTVTEEADGHIPGAVTFEGQDKVRWTADAPSLPTGIYLLQLFGDADKDTGRPAIAGIEGLRLDGESNHPLPSGDGAEGGEFRVRFRVVGQTPGGDRQ